MNKKILYGAIFIVVLVIAIAGTYYITSSTAPKTTATITLQVLTVFGAGSIKSGFEQALDNFMALHPDIYVRHEPIDQTTLNTVLPIWLASGKAPDVFMWLGGEQTQNFVNAGYLGNISDIYDSIKGYFSPGVQNQIISYNGTPYAVPLDSNVYGCFYSKDIFNAYNITVPTTFSELITDCQTIQNGSKGAISPFMIADGFPWLADECLSAIMSRAVSGTYMRELTTGQAKWTDPQAEQCLYYFSELMPYLYPGATELTDYDAAAAFARNAVAMEFVGPWRLGMITDVNASANIGWFPTPSINTAYDHQLAAHSDVLVMSKDTKYPQQCEELLQYLASPAAQQTFGVVSNQPVPNLQVPSSAYNGTMVQIINSQADATDIVMEIGLMTLNQVAKNNDRTILQKLIFGTENYTQVAEDLSKLPWGQPNS
jgi:ABC-type glycerol-3-phosphate transport system substrate-binding protein